VTRRSIQEYVAALRRRYEQATKKQKGSLLDEFCQTTGYHRKAAIRRLRHLSALRPAPRRRRRKYGPAVAQPLHAVWEVTDHVCSKRLAPFLPELIPILEQHGEIQLAPEVREKLLHISPSTIDRLLKPFRMPSQHRPHTQSEACRSVQGQVPIRTFGEWKNVVPGSLQADLVAHCGLQRRLASGEGEHPRLLPEHAAGIRRPYRLDQSAGGMGQEPRASGRWSAQDTPGVALPLTGATH
jgi:hypothetical protein